MTHGILHKKTDLRDIVATNHEAEKKDNSLGQNENSGGKQFLAQRRRKAKETMANLMNQLRVIAPDMFQSIVVQQQRFNNALSPKCMNANSPATKGFDNITFKRGTEQRNLNSLMKQLQVTASGMYLQKAHQKRLHDVLSSASIRPSVLSVLTNTKEGVIEKKERAKKDLVNLMNQMQLAAPTFFEQLGVKTHKTQRILATSVNDTEDAIKKREKAKKDFKKLMKQLQEVDPAIFQQINVKQQKTKYVLPEDSGKSIISLPKDGMKDVTRKRKEAKKDIKNLMKQSQVDPEIFQQVNVKQQKKKYVLPEDSGKSIISLPKDGMKDVTRKRKEAKKDIKNLMKQLQMLDPEIHRQVIKKHQKIQVF